MAAGIMDPMILLRVIDLASKSSIETQKWASTALFDLISKSRDDPLLLINVFELLSDLDVTVIHESISLLHQLGDLNLKEEANSRNRISYRKNWRSYTPWKL